MPAIKLGLSNVVVMYALLFLRTRTRAAASGAEGTVRLLTRGATAGFFSFAAAVYRWLSCWCCCTCRSAGISFVPVLHWRITSANWRGQPCCFPARWLWGTPRAVGGRLAVGGIAVCFPEPYSLPCLPLRGAGQESIQKIRIFLKNAVLPLDTCKAMSYNIGTDTGMCPMSN